VRGRLLGFIVLCCACVVARAQTFYGPGGLIINPTAYTDHAGFLQFNASLFNQFEPGGITSIYPASVVYAVSDQFELGGIYIGEKTYDRTTNRAGIFLKQGLLKETTTLPAIALVGTAVTGYGTASSLTLAVSKEVLPHFHLHVGARAMETEWNTRADGNLYAGADYQIAKNYKLIAEIDSRLYVYPNGSAAFGIQYDGPILLTVGAVAQGSNRFGFFVGAGYPIGRP
jgi:hypothetical protein